MIDFKRKKLVRIAAQIEEFSELISEQMEEILGDYPPVVMIVGIGSCDILIEGNIDEPQEFIEMVALSMRNNETTH